MRKAGYDHKGNGDLSKEGISPEELRQYMAEGKAVIPANKLHKCLNPNGVGSMLKTKINVNLGTSRDWKDVDMELQKVQKRRGNRVQNPLWILSSYGDTTKVPPEADSGVPCHYWNCTDL